MKKNLGNGIVKRVIAVAMATMLVAASPVMESAATDSTPVLSTDEINTTIKGAVDSAKDYVDNGSMDNAVKEAEKVVEEVTTVTKELDELNLEVLDKNIPPIQDAANQAIDTMKQVQDHIDELEAPVLSDEEATLVGGLYGGLTDVYDKYSDDNGVVDHFDTYDIADDTTSTIENVVKGSISKEMADATNAATETENKAAGAVNIVDDYLKYDTAADTLLNNDNALVDAVEGNTDNIIEAIEENGEIMVNVEDADGVQSQKELTSYVTEKADSAEAAADVAQGCVDSIVNNANANIAEERAKLDQALADAVVAKTDAENAYHAAQAVLLDQIKRYNAYATLYGEKLYTLEDGSAPAYSTEELAELEGIEMNGEDLSTGLKGVGNINFDAQDKEIKATEKLVNSCETSLESAQEAVNYAMDVKNSLVTNLTKLREEANTALATTTDAKQKELLQKICDHTNYILTEYTKDLTPTGEENRNPNGDTDNIENRMDYALDSANNLTTELNTWVQQEKVTLGETLDRYNAAVTEYNAVMAEYDKYIKENQITDASATLDARFEAIKAKLETASGAVDAAAVQLNRAVDAVNKANSAKDNFEKAVANMNGNKSESGSSSNSGNSTGSTTVVVVTDANGLASISEEAVPLTDVVPTTDVPFTEIIDEASPLTDSVPKTGDASAAAGAVGASGLIAMLGALFMGNKKRTLR
ncbi:MAG: hypothetical protein IJN64_13850 [Lachnospiraceae bacterium]|nr:hypothetical protein [Lachnospiraceae bacterium]